MERRGVGEPKGHPVHGSRPAVHDGPRRSTMVLLAALVPEFRLDALLMCRRVYLVVLLHFHFTLQDSACMFQNQSGRTIAQKFFESRCGFHKKSHLNVTVQDWFDQYPAAPLIGSNIEAPDGCNSIDIVKGYCSVAGSMNENWCIMSTTAVPVGSGGGSSCPPSAAEVLPSTMAAS